MRHILQRICAAIAFRRACKKREKHIKQIRELDEQLSELQKQLDELQKQEEYWEAMKIRARNSEAS